MDECSLEEFRRRWQEELAQAQAPRKWRRPDAAERRARRPEVASGRSEQAPGDPALAQGLLEGAGRPPAARATRAEAQDVASRSRFPRAREGAGGGEQLVDQLIRDLVSGSRLLPRPAPAPALRTNPCSDLENNCVPLVARENE
ncbi:F-box/WD repeat-containing protein 8 [Saguinus oedipus]|uniref:F-box/WD repeat-containing protein 8 n=1 Tax=Saguinus oedipus TaxID=9490 RepID=A0ABQ9V020_SAGOE|nr:F-box/WD repeat-containing protein 8 [Saguinus oedipus]